MHAGILQDPSEANVSPLKGTESRKARGEVSSGFAFICVVWIRLSFVKAT